MNNRKYNYIELIIDNQLSLIDISDEPLEISVPKRMYYRIPLMKVRAFPYDDIYISKIEKKVHALSKIFKSTISLNLQRYLRSAISSNRNIFDYYNSSSSSWLRYI